MIFIAIFIVCSFFVPLASGYKICTGNASDILWNGKCYSSQGMRADFDASEIACDTWKMGAHLVSLHSAEEEDFVVNQVRIADPMWIGLRKVDYDKKSCPLATDLYWTDGSDITYAHEHPLQCDTKCYCIAIDYGGEQWHDRGCTSGPYNAVCKYSLSCHGIPANDEVNVCNGHGRCFSDDLCTCDSTNYYDLDCNSFKCFGIQNNDTSSVCNSNGNCTDHNQCECNLGYYGQNCSLVVEETCEVGTKYNGNCYTVIESAENRNFTGSEYHCRTLFHDSHLASIHTLSEDNFISSSFFVANSEPLWIGLKKNDSSSPCPTANGYLLWTDGTNTSYAEEEKTVNCDQNGELCISIHPDGSWNDESCLNMSLGAVCEYPIPYCNDIRGDDFPNFCNGRGRCVRKDFCECVDPLYYGDDCENYKCFGFGHDDYSKVCSGHGDCTDIDRCKCDEGYTGDKCNVTMCFNYMESDLKYVCSARGKCEAKDLCICDENYAGTECQFTHPCQNEGDIYNSTLQTCYHYFSNASAGEVKRSILAEGICRKWNDWNGHLVSIQSREEELFVRSLLTTDTWTGAEKIGATESVCPGQGYDWTDKTNGINGSYSFEEWVVVCDDTSQWMKYIAYIDAAKEFQDVQDNIDMAALCKAPVAVCNNTPAAEINVCSQKGVCYRNDTCLCSNPRDYIGNLCEVTFCDGILSNDTKNTCSSHGACWPFDTCECAKNDFYTGQFCEVTWCYDVISNSTGVCGGHGTCWPVDTCECDEGFFGNEICNVTACDGIFSNDTSNPDLCSSHGDCVGLDICNCSEHYSGKWCEETTCGGIGNLRKSKVCSNRGDCIAYDNCVCDTDYYGDYCKVTKCNDIFSNETGIVCNGHGKCLSHQYCACEQIKGSVFIGEYCQPDHPCIAPGDEVFEGHCYRNFGKTGSMNDSEIFCGKWRTDSHLVSILSAEEDSFIQTSTLVNQQAWLGLTKLPRPDPKYPCPGPGFRWSDGASQAYANSEKSDLFCRGNGSCFVTNTLGDWEDVLCSNYSDSIETVCKYEIPVCGGLPGNNASGCTNHGWCVDNDYCFCYNQGYNGFLCNETFCAGISSTSEDVCLKHGTCWPKDTCDCFTDYFGPNCMYTTCDDILSNYTQEVCNGHGWCYPKDVCGCEEGEGYYGGKCLEYIDPLAEILLNINESKVFIPYVVPVDIIIQFRRSIENNELVSCDDRIPNFRDFLGSDEDWPPASCYWQVNQSFPDRTTGLIHQINYHSPIYDPVPNGQKYEYVFHLHLLTEDKNVSVTLTREGAIVPPPRPPNDDDDDDDNGGTVIGVVGGVVGGLTAGLLSLIILGSICSFFLITCVTLCVVFCLAVCTFGCGMGILMLILCTGTTAGTTAVGGAVVGKEVVDEVNDEGPDFVKDAIREKWDAAKKNREQGLVVGADGVLEMELGDDDEFKEEYVTDNLQEAVFRQDDDVVGLDLGQEQLDNEEEGVQLENVGIEDDHDFGIDLGGGDMEGEKDLQTEKAKEMERKKREEEKEMEIQRQKEKEMKKKAIQSKMDRIQEKREDMESLSLGTRFARKKLKKTKKMLNKKEKVLEKKLDGVEESKEQDSGLSLKRFKDNKSKGKGKLGYFGDK